MVQEFFQVDAFTQTPFTGNPAGVCILPGAVSEDWMKAVAREMNLSETAFLVRQDGLDPSQQWYNLRWFTPAAEVDLCGHATLASAHILWETGLLPPEEQARFYTRSGMLTADQRGDWIEMNFPAKPEQPATVPGNFPEILGVRPRYVGRNQFDYLVEVESESVLRQMAPDFQRLKRLPVRGVIVTCLPAAPSPYDFLSRFFAPAVGVNEDPVTGSAHTCLAGFWGKRLDKSEMTAYQASARGGVVKVRLAGDRVFLSGQAVTVIKGDLL